MLLLHISILILFRIYCNVKVTDLTCIIGIQIVAYLQPLFPIVFMSLLLINFALTNMELLSVFVAYKAVYNCLHVERELINGFVV